MKSKGPLLFFLANLMACALLIFDLFRRLDFYTSAEVPFADRLQSLVIFAAVVFALCNALALSLLWWMKQKAKKSV